jgi:hypothetical protein
MKQAIIIFILFVGLLVSGCIKDVLPSDATTTATLTKTPDGLK